MYSTILDSTEAQLEKAEAKITYFGVQTKPIATVVFHTPGCEPVMQEFASLHRTHKLYANDESPYTRYFVVTPHEFLEILQSLKPVLIDAATSQDSELLSFTIIRKQGSSTEGHEFKIGSAAGKSFYQAMFKAVSEDNELGKKILQKQFVDIFPQ